MIRAGGPWTSEGEPVGPSGPTGLTRGLTTYVMTPLSF